MEFSAFVQGLQDGSDISAFKQFGRHLDAEWVSRALAETGTASIRRRKLPAQLAVWLVIGMALFRDRSIAAVVKHLGLVFSAGTGRAAVGNGSVVPAAISAARARIGEEPLRQIFFESAEVWSSLSSEAERWHGLTVYAVDGTTFRVPDSPANREEFGLPASSRGQAGYPQVRAVTLTAARSHMIRAAAFGPCRGKGTGEQTLARQLWDDVPPGSVVILDKGFLNYSVLWQLSALGDKANAMPRHWLIRAKSGLSMNQLVELGEGDSLVEIKLPTDARRADADMPATMQVRAIQYQVEDHEPQILLTSLLDATRYPALDIACLYHERWEIELSYDEIKTHMLEREEALRSKTPTAVAQEIWGLLIAYNLVRCRMLEVAHDAGVPQTQVSFRNTIHLVRIFCLVEAWDDAASKLPERLSGLREMLSLLLLPSRRSDRTYPRHVKIKMSSYARNPGRPDSQDIEMYEEIR